MKEDMWYCFKVHRYKKVIFSLCAILWSVIISYFFGGAVAGLTGVGSIEIWWPVFCVLVLIVSFGTYGLGNIVQYKFNNEKLYVWYGLHMRYEFDLKSTTFKIKNEARIVSWVILKRRVPIKYLSVIYAIRDSDKEEVITLRTGAFSDNQIRQLYNMVSKVSGITMVNNGQDGVYFIPNILCKKQSGLFANVPMLVEVASNMVVIDGKIFPYTKIKHVKIISNERNKNTVNKIIITRGIRRYVYSFGKESDAFDFQRLAQNLADNVTTI